MGRSRDLSCRADSLPGLHSLGHTDGSAHRGISLSCRRLASLGAIVVLVDVQADKLDAAVATLGEKGLTAFSQAIDVTKQDQWAGAAQAVFDKYGRIDVLVQAAGITGKTGACVAERGGGARAWCVPPI